MGLVYVIVIGLIGSGTGYLTDDSKDHCKSNTAVVRINGVQVDCKVANEMDVKTLSLAQQDK